MAITKITSNVIEDGGIDTVHIADNQVTLAKMAGITRGSIIIGNSSGDPAALAIGSNDYVLTSDGTDLAWEAAASSGAALTGSTDNTVVTVTGSNAIQGEANMTFDGTDLTIPNKIVHGGDTDTYLYFQANDFAIFTGGQQGFNQVSGVNYMNSTSPTDPSGSAERSYIYHDNAGNTSLHVGTQYGSDSAAIHFETRNNKRMTILGSGNVGIGTTSPSNLLHVSGSLATNVPGITLTNSNSSGWPQGFHHLLPSLSTGQEAAGVSVGTEWNSYNAAKLGFYYAGDGSTSNLLTLGFHSRDKAMTVAANGNVGIGLGTTVASTPLHVNGAITSNDLFLTNEGKDPNIFDGTNGSWQIQEGSDDLFIMNKLTGKKYKFKLEEI